MQNIILNNSAMIELYILIPLTLFAFAITFTLIQPILALGYQVRKYYKHLPLFALSVIAFFISLNLLIFSAKKWYNQDNINHQLEQTSIQHYYDYTKEGQLITATRKSSAPDILNPKLTAKIVSEDKTSYQVEHKGQYDSVPKAYLK